VDLRALCRLLGSTFGQPDRRCLEHGPKYLASNTLTDPQWANTTVLSGDVAAAVGELKAKPGGELQVHGSGKLVRWLLDNHLVDEINLLIVPVVVGQGTRLFPDTGPDIALDLLDSRAFPKGITIQVYRPPGARSTQRPRPEAPDIGAAPDGRLAPAVWPRPTHRRIVHGVRSHRSTALEENNMTATYTFDVFSSLDGYGAASANWSGYWGKQGPELLDHRLALYGAEQRMIFGANTYRAFERMLASSSEESEVRDPWVTRMRSLPATVVSTTLEGPLSWPNATVVSGDAVDVVARLKEESEVPLRSHGSLSLNRALMAAGLVDRLQVTLFPVITGQTGLDPIFRDAADFDLELVENRTLDGHIQELIYRPTLH
jgi:dihydrofolate reductase